MIRIKIKLEKNATNHHGTQNRFEQWNRETVFGPRFAVVDLMGGIRERENHNPEGGKSRAIWYKRFIYYFPSGKWWNLDVAVVRPLMQKAGK